MPATLKHIQINFQRIQESGNPQLLPLLTAAREDSGDGTGAVTDLTGPQVQHTWKRFVELAEQAHVGDLIPGTVGREFARRYGTLKPRSARGPRMFVVLTDAARIAVERYRKESDAFCVEVSQDSRRARIVFTSRRRAVASVQAMIKRSRLDIQRSASESAHSRAALNALLAKVEQGESSGP